LHSADRAPGRRERAAHPERAEVVHFHLGSRRAEVGRSQQRLHQKLSGVVHEDRDVRAVARGALDRGLVGHVELYGHDAIRSFLHEMRSASRSRVPT
jgi:hypothetical protein